MCGYGPQLCKFSNEKEVVGVSMQGRIPSYGGVQMIVQKHERIHALV